MLNQSAEYALRAMLYIAGQGEGAACKAPDIGRAIGVSASYLSKVLHLLVRAHVLRSERGPTGGYALAVAPSELELERLIAPFQELEPRGHCLMGDRACDKTQPCVAHQRWVQMRDEIASFLRNTTLADMLAPLPQGSVRPDTLTEVA